jgi:hypothetical protein
MHPPTVTVAAHNIQKKYRNSVLWRSYRPITILSIIRKVFEKVLLSLIISYALMGDNKLDFWMYWAVGKPIGC